MSDKTQLIDIEGLKVFKEQYDILVDEKISKIGNTTYTLTKNTDGEIVLTGSDESVTKVSDANTTYTFVENNHVLTITGTDGTSESFTIGGGSEITKQAIIDALGFEPVDSDDIPTSLSDLSEDATHRLVTDIEKSTWNGKADVSQIPTKASDIGALPDTTDLSVYALATESGYDLGLTVDESTYEMTVQLKNKAGTVLSTKSVDLPIESMVIGADYADGILTLTLQNGETLDVDISAIVGGLVNDTFTIAGIDMKDDITAEELKTALGIPSSYAPTDAQANVIETIKVNNAALTPSGKSVNISVPTSASDIGAMESTVTHLSGDVPTTRKVNGKALSSDITLSASDVNALPSDTIIPTILYGTSEPTSTQGKNGDIYIKLMA